MLFKSIYLIAFLELLCYNNNNLSIFNICNHTNIKNYSCIHKNNRYKYKYNRCYEEAFIITTFLNYK